MLESEVRQAAARIEAGGVPGAAAGGGSGEAGEE